MVLFFLYYSRVGFEKEQIEALLHKIEIQIKHQSTNFGLSLASVSDMQPMHQTKKIRQCIRFGFYLCLDVLNKYECCNLGGKSAIYFGAQKLFDLVKYCYSIFWIVSPFRNLPLLSSDSQVLSCVGSVS